MKTINYLTKISYENIYMLLNEVSAKLQEYEASGFSKRKHSKCALTIKEENIIVSFIFIRLSLYLSLYLNTLFFPVFHFSICICICIDNSNLIVFVYCYYYSLKNTVNFVTYIITFERCLFKRIIIVYQK